MQNAEPHIFPRRNRSLVMSDELLARLDERAIRGTKGMYLKAWSDQDCAEAAARIRVQARAGVSSVREWRRFCDD